MSYMIATVNDAERLVNVCRRFHEDVDVIYQRQVIDAKSMLGVISLIGHMVAVRIITEDHDVKHAFKLELYI